MGDSEKSMNKLWKESGTTLSFKEYVDRENKKKSSEGNFFNLTGTETVSALIDKTISDTTKVTIPKTGLKSTANPNLVLGLDKRIIIFSAVLIVASIGYYVYVKNKKK